MSKYELETIQPGEARYYAVPSRKIAPLVTLLRKKTGNAYVVTKTGEGCRVIREGTAIMTNTWPDPAQPGVPLNPEKDGAHRLKHRESGLECDALWSCFGTWLDTAGDFSVRNAEMFYIYLGPCLTPAEVDARVAEAQRAGVKEALQHARGYEAIAYQHGNLPALDPHECAAQAAREIAAGIEALMEKKDE